MKKILIIALSILTSIVFTACGGGGGGSSFKQTIVDITVTCVAPNVFANYITLYAGDTIVNDQPGTIVTTYHNINGETKVCLNTGAAHIVRK